MRVFIVGDTGVLDGLALWSMTDEGDVLLYTASDTLPTATSDEIERLDPTEIIIVGGTARVDENVESALALLAPTSRVAGGTRFSTAVAISSTVYPAEPSVEPPAFYIPAYQGNPDVGLTDPDALTLYTGSSTIPAGTYVNKEFIGAFSLYDSSTFVNCWFHNPSGHVVHNALMRGGTRQYFTDCQFGAEGESADRRLSSGGGTYTAVRCNISDGEDGMKLCPNAIIRMCHVHDLWTTDAEPHYDAIQAESGMTDALIEYSNIQCMKRDGTIGNTGATFIKADLGTADIENVTIRNNYLNGGTYTMSLRNSTNNVTGSVVTDNIFGPDYQYGHWRVDTGTVDTWSGNVDTFGVPVTL